MTAAVTQRIVNRLRLLPDDRESVIMHFIALIESNGSVDREAVDRIARSDAFLDSFLNADIDEQAIAEFRERSMI